MKSIKFHIFDVKAIVTKKEAYSIPWKYCQKKRNVMIEILSWLWWKQIKFFKMDPYYFKILPATFLNYTNQRQEQKENYDITSQI